MGISGSDKWLAVAPGQGDGRNGHVAGIGDGALGLAWSIGGACGPGRRAQGRQAGRPGQGGAGQWQPCLQPQPGGAVPKVAQRQNQYTVQAGQRWQAVRLGEELKDPQTGRSLGRSEHPCCTIRIDRVAAQTSYGTIEDGVDAMRGGFRPGQIELRQKLGSKPAAAAAGATASAAPAAAARPAAKPKPKPAAAPAEDPNW